MNDFIKVFEIVQKTSKKGNAYSVLHIEFSAGYTFEKFLNNEEEFCLRSAINFTK